ncbi:hypothetical protein N9L68_00370 [bacterium]|nr:hypothetical protein [bacterium]
MGTPPRGAGDTVLPIGKQSEGLGPPRWEAGDTTFGRRTEDTVSGTGNTVGELGTVSVGIGGAALARWNTAPRNWRHRLGELGTPSWNSEQRLRRLGTPPGAVATPSGHLGAPSYGN